MKDFWVKNVGKCNVSLRDLALTIKARSTVNLLDSKHYSYTLEQLQQSAESGSIFAKRHFIKVCKVPPQPVEKPQLVLASVVRDGIKKNLVEITAPRYEELDDSDEKFAEELADVELNTEDSE